MSNEIIERKYQSMIGAEVIGIDGPDSQRTGYVKQLSINEHSVLGTLAQVWIEWDYNPGHLEPSFPWQIKPWAERKGCGVYLAPKGVN